MASAASECSSIKHDKPRLACYDKLNAPSVEKDKAEPLAATNTLKADKVFRRGVWHVHETLDPMTDKKSCTALYRNGWAVQGTANTLYVSVRGRGGVRAYIVRVDDSPADPLVLATDMEKKLSAVDLAPNFERIYNAKRLRLQISTILSTMINEDIDLNGLKESIDYIRSTCAAS